MANGDNENQNQNDNENDDLGLNADEEPSATAYDSESAAPLGTDEREEVRERLKGRAVWESANETGDPTGNEVENGPEVDPSDPNLSATFAEAGAEDRQDTIAMLDAEEFALDDPEADEEEP